MKLEDKIRSFVSSEDVVMEALAMLKVGNDKGDSPQVIMQHLLAHTLFRFHGIPLKLSDQN